jgi:chitinase
VCSSTNVEYVTIAFVNQSPENVKHTNYPGTNFAGHCAGYTYKVNGESSNLLSGCTEIKEDISKCQEMGIKVLLSIGGQFDAGANYTISTPEKGQEFADFLWYAFGPYDPSWTGPRPFDLDDTHRSKVDGFDIDVEKKFGKFLHCLLMSS